MFEANGSGSSTPQESIGTHVRLLSLDRSGFHWLHAVPAAWLLVTAVEWVLRRGWDDDPTSLVYICCPEELSALQILYIVLSVTYVVYPTILGWSFVAVPCFIFLVRILVDGDVAASVVLQAALGLFCVGLWIYRPKNASRRTVFASVVIALAIEGIVFGPAIWA